MQTPMTSHRPSYNFWKAAKHCLFVVVVVVVVVGITKEKHSAKLNVVLFGKSVIFKILATTFNFKLIDD